MLSDRGDKYIGNKLDVGRDDLDTPQFHYINKFNK